MATFLDAMVPADGENAIDVVPLTQLLIDRAGAGWRIPPLPGTFGVTDPDDVARLRTMLSDEPVRCLQQRVRLGDPAAAAIPRTHIHCVAGGPPERRPVPAADQV